MSVRAAVWPQEDAYSAQGVWLVFKMRREGCMQMGWVCTGMGQIGAGVNDAGVRRTSAADAAFHDAHVARYLHEAIDRVELFSDGLRSSPARPPLVPPPPRGAAAPPHSPAGDAPNAPPCAVRRRAAAEEAAEEEQEEEATAGSAACIEAQAESHCAASDRELAWRRTAHSTPTRESAPPSAPADPPPPPPTRRASRSACGPSGRSATSPTRTCLAMPSAGV